MRENRVRVLIVYGGEIFVLNTKYPHKFFLPFNRVKFYETPDKAVKRISKRIFGTNLQSCEYLGQVDLLRTLTQYKIRHLY